MVTATDDTDTRSFILAFDSHGAPRVDFGPRGMVVIKGYPGSGLALLPDGSIIAMDQWVSPYTGTPVFGEVRKFDSLGRIAERLGIFGGASDVVAQPDGKLVVVGGGCDSTGNNRNLLLMRCASDGSLDSTFGLAGVAMYDGAMRDEGYAVALQTDGKILAAGFTYDYTNSDLLLLRFDSNGMPDASFGAGGAVIYHSGYQYGGRDIAPQPDGKILVTGTTVDGSGKQGILLLRFMQDGTRDASFGTQGVVAYNGGSWNTSMAVAVQPDKRILVAGASDGSVVLLRYTSAGVLDKSFGNGGVVSDLPGGGNDVLVQSDGKILVGGMTALPGINYPVALVARYNQNGERDYFFGTGGVVAYDASYGAGDGIRRLALDANGNIVALGWAGSVGTSAGNMLLMRLLGNCSNP